MQIDKTLNPHLESNLDSKNNGKSQESESLKYTQSIQKEKDIQDIQENQSNQLNENNQEKELQTIQINESNEQQNLNNDYLNNQQNIIANDFIYDSLQNSYLSLNNQNLPQQSQQFENITQHDIQNNDEPISIQILKNQENIQNISQNSFKQDDLLNPMIQDLMTQSNLQKEIMPAMFPAMLPGAIPGMMPAIFPGMLPAAMPGIIPNLPNIPNLPFIPNMPNMPGVLPGMIPQQLPGFMNQMPLINNVVDFQNIQNQMKQNGQSDVQKLSGFQNFPNLIQSPIQQFGLQTFPSFLQNDLNQLNQNNGENKAQNSQVIYNTPQSSHQNNLSQMQNMMLNNKNQSSLLNNFVQQIQNQTLDYEKLLRDQKNMQSYQILSQYPNLIPSMSSIQMLNNYNQFMLQLQQLNGINLNFLNQNNNQNLQYISQNNQQTNISKKQNKEKKIILCDNEPSLHRILLNKLGLKEQTNSQTQQQTDDILEKCFVCQNLIVDEIKQAQFKFDLDQCQKCKSFYHQICVNKFQNNESQTKCLICLLDIIDPFQEIQQIVMKPSVFYDNEQSFNFDFTQQQQQLINDNADYYFEIRSIIIQQQQCWYPSWIDKGILQINNTIIGQFKPIPVGSSQKNRKDEFFQTKKQYLFKEYNNVLTINQTQSFKDQFYLIGIYIVKKLDTQSLINQYKQQPQLSIEECKQNLVNDLKEQGIQQIKVSLKDIIDNLQIKTPVKGIYCKHINCYSLENIIQNLYYMNNRRWTCPICRQPIQQLKIDTFIQQILIENPDALQINLDENANILQNILFETSQIQKEKVYYSIKTNPKNNIIKLKKRIKKIKQN